MDYYEILGVSRGAELKQIHIAFRTLSKKMHPDRVSEDLRPKAEAEYRQIVKAYNTLKDPKQRDKYDKTLSSPAGSRDEVSKESQFQNYYRAGVNRYNNRQYEHAVEFMKKAVFCKPHAEAYYYKGSAESRVPRRKKDAVDSLQKAVEMDPFNAKYLKAYAKLLYDVGLRARAKAAVRKALELLPDDSMMLNLMDELEPESDKKSGILGGLWGRLKGDDS